MAEATKIRQEYCDGRVRVIRDEYCVFRDKGDSDEVETLREFPATTTETFHREATDNREEAEQYAATVPGAWVKRCITLRGKFAVCQYLTEEMALEGGKLAESLVRRVLIDTLMGEVAALQSEGPAASPEEWENVMGVHVRVRTAERARQEQANSDAIDKDLRSQLDAIPDGGADGLGAEETQGTAEGESAGG